MGWYIALFQCIFDRFLREVSSDIGDIFKILMYWRLNLFLFYSFHFDLVLFTKFEYVLTFINIELIHEFLVNVLASLASRR